MLIILKKIPKYDILYIGRGSDIMKNRKGFTLVELLTTILIIALISVVVTFIVITTINKSKDNVKTISFEGFKSSVFTYINEFKKDDIYWNKLDDEVVYACTTVKALKNKGFFDNNAIIYDKDKNKLNDTSYVMVTKNSITLSLIDVLIDDDKCNDNFNPEVEFTPKGTIGYDNWYNTLFINYLVKINDKSKIDSINYNLKIDNKEVGTSTTKDLEKEIKVNNEGKKINLCLTLESLNGTIKDSCSDSYKLDMTIPNNPSLTLDKDGNILVKDGIDNLSGTKETLLSFTNDNFSDKNTILNTLNNPKDGEYNIYSVSMDYAKNYSNTTHAIYVVSSSLNGKVNYHSDIIGYKCSLDGKTYSTIDEATNACKKVETVAATKNEYYTYSCPSGYTCSNGTCTSTSKCVKTVSKTPDKVYYCEHNKTYQSSSVCSYSGEELASTDLYCASNGNTCSDSYYYYCSEGYLDGKYCYKGNQYSAAPSNSSWNSYQTGYCNMHCEGPGHTGGIVSCSSGVVKCNEVGQNFSCVAGDGSTLGGWKYCTKNVQFTWYRSANIGVKKVCTEVGKYRENGYSGCRNNYQTGNKTIKFNYANGLSCSGTGTKEGTLSCTYKGYTLTDDKNYIVDSNGNDACSQPLKVYNGSYCNTAKYHSTKSCSDPGTSTKGGASTVYTRTCVNNNPPVKYYCSLTDKYSDSTSCSTTYEENIIITKNTSYSCKSGYTLNSNNTCSKIVTGELETITNNYYTCSLFNNQKYTNEKEATSACSNYCDNNLKYYSKKNKCLNLKEI